MGLGEKPVLGRKKLVWGVMRCRACRYMREKIMMSKLETMSKQGAMKRTRFSVFNNSIWSHNLDMEALCRTAEKCFNLKRRLL